MGSLGLHYIQGSVKQMGLDRMVVVSRSSILDLISRGGREKPHSLRLNLRRTLLGLSYSTPTRALRVDGSSLTEASYLMRLARAGRISSNLTWAMDLADTT